MVKLRFGLILAIVAGFVLLACGYLGMGYVSAVSDYDLSKGQIAMTLEALRKTTAQNGVKSAELLQGQIDRAVAELQRVQSSYPSIISETRTINILLDIAETNGIIIKIVTCSESVKKTDERAYPLTSFRLDIEGSYDCILHFLNAIEGSPPESRMQWLVSMAVDSVNLAIIEEPLASSPDGIPVVTIGGMTPASTTQKYEGRIAVVAYSAPELLPKKVSASASKTK